MKTQFIYSTLCAILALSIASCGKTQSPPPQQQTQPASQPQPAAPITVKGFYIGMPADDVRQVGNNLYGWDKGGNKTEGKDMIEISFPASDSKASLDDCVAQFEFDANHKLKRIFMGYVAVNSFFNAANLNSDDFIQQFANAYKIPEFKQRLQPNGVSQWVYVSPDNIAITIYRDKTLVIKYDNSPAETKNSFN